MRLLISCFTGLLLALTSVAAWADKAILIDEAVLVEVNPEAPIQDDGEVIDGVPPPALPEIGTATKATYAQEGGWAVTSPAFIDAQTLVYDFGGTTSVSGATLTLDIEEVFPLNGSALMNVYAFSDDGVIDLFDYRRGFGQPIASVDMAGRRQVVVEITGFVNAALRSGRYVGLRIESAVAPEDVPDDIFPKYVGAKLYPNAVLDFNPGPAPVLPAGEAAFDGFTLVVPAINVPGFGVVNTRFQMSSLNNAELTLVQADIVSGGSSQSAVFFGIDLYNCSVVPPPSSNDVLSSGSIVYSTSSGQLGIPALRYRNDIYSAELIYQAGTEPMKFYFAALDLATNSGSAPNTVAALGGAITVEATQDFIPLCNGWVLIGDTSRNRIVERNVITGATGKVYPFGTKPKELLLDEERGLLYFNVHPESQRLYKLNLNSGVISNHRLTESIRKYSVRDIALGENGNLFTILFDAEQAEPADPLEPTAASGLWLGLLNSDGGIIRPSIPLADPIRIEYDRIFKRVFLTTQSNLATFNFEPISMALTFVEGTDISVGTGCTDFSISPDGRRLAYPCPAGNLENDVDTPHVGIHDLDPVDYRNPDGEWYLGSTPVSTTFNPNGTLLLATDGTRLVFFDVVTHLQLREYPLGLLEGEVVRKLRFSKDGNYVLILLSNELGAPSSKIYWMPVPTDVVGTPL